MLNILFVCSGCLFVTHCSQGNASRRCTFRSCLTWAQLCKSERICKPSHLHSSSGKKRILASDASSRSEEASWVERRCPVRVVWRSNLPRVRLLCSVSMAVGCGPVKANLLTEILDFRGFDSSIIDINFKGWNSQAHREFAGKCESTNLSRDNLRELGRTSKISGPPPPFGPSRPLVSSGPGMGSIGFRV